MEKWIFTFGYGQRHAGHYVVIEGTYDSARAEMFKRYGPEWAFQYSVEQWENYKKKGLATETLLKEENK